MTVLFRHQNGILVLTATTALAISYPSIAGTVFTENFTSLTITQNSVGAGAPLQCSNGTPTNVITFTPSPSSLANKWSFHSSGNYPLSWSGINSTGAWATDGTQMYFHGVKGPYDDGHAVLSKATFDKSKYIVASADIKAYCSNGTSGCWAGIALINQESNYRGLYLGTQTGGQVQVQRLAPCNAQQTSHSFPANTWQNIGVEYRGPEGGWSYYINGQRIASTAPLFPIGVANFVMNGTEFSQSNNSDTSLTSNPRLGIYTNTNHWGSYVEGSISNISVKVLNKITPASASASSSFLPAANAIDNNLTTAWVANTSGNQWIELDLGTVKNIQKIRLLTEQSKTENTIHNVFIGTTPGPTMLSTTFSGVTTTGQWLDKTFLPNAVVGRYVRITTPTSTSWRAWREIQIYD